ncbi:MAG: UxaA family hydrolase [Colwellia sp.]
MSVTKFVLLNKADNVLICCQASKSGDLVCIDEQQVNITADIDVGHKIARDNIMQGGKIIRYGVPIGSATRNIVIGEHIHLHNMKSDYIPSHTRQSVVGE